MQRSFTPAHGKNMPGYARLRSLPYSFALRFEAADGENGRFFSAGRPGHLQFDIGGYVAARLAAAGVAPVEMLDEDTYAQPDRFFSYRRSCHRGEAGYGRQMSMIGVPE